MKNFIDNLTLFGKKHAELLYLLILAAACYFVLFYNLGGYPLIDVDETRYVAMAREMIQRNDWMTLYLNGEFFFEKPPLYFWMLAGMFKLFGTTTEFLARLPIAIVSTFGIFFTYFFGRKAISKTFGLVSALILLTSFEYILLSRIAILDLVLSVFIAASIFSGFLSLYCSEHLKKFAWWFAYLFAGLAFLTKGIPGVAVPALTLFFGMLATGNIKELFKPKNLIIGWLIFFAVTVPWHLAMIKIHGDLFINEYIIKHHIARFADSSHGLGRKEPFWYFIPVFLVGFIPWTFTLLGSLIQKFRAFAKKLEENIPVKDILNTDTKERLILVLSGIYFIVTFLFFSVSSTKLATYILPAFPAVALISGHFWSEYIKKERYKKAIEISSLILLIIFGFAGILAFLALENLPMLSIALFKFAKLASMFTALAKIAAIWFTIFFILGMLSLKFKNRAGLFASQVLLMIGIIIISSHSLFNFIYSFGQNEIVEYATKAKLSINSKLITFDYGVRSSALYAYGKEVKYVTEYDIKKLAKELNTKEKSFVIVKTKQMDGYYKDFEKLNLKLVKKGNKYSLFEEQ